MNMSPEVKYAYNKLVTLCACEDNRFAEELFREGYIAKCELNDVAPLSKALRKLMAAIDNQMMDEWITAFSKGFALGADSVKIL